MPAKPLGRDRRLADGAVFQALLRKGRRHIDGVITAKVLAGRDVRKGSGRLGLSIAKRWIRRAVDRNRLKRLVREAYRLRGDTTDGMDVLFMLTEGGATKDILKRLPDELRTQAGRQRVRTSVNGVLDALGRTESRLIERERAVP